MADSKSDTPRDLNGLIAALGVQRQCDEDGVLCAVSRQAVDEAIAVLRELAAAPTFGCHCDLEDGQAPDGCVLDAGRPQDCIYAQKLLREGQGKTSCVYWLQVAPGGAA